MQSRRPHDKCAAISEQFLNQPEASKLSDGSPLLADHVKPNSGRTLSSSTDFPDGWALIRQETEKHYFRRLNDFLQAERETNTVLPPEEHVFAALEATPLDQVKVLLLGQDPYHDIGQAHGLCFSVLPGVKLPPSLKNIYKELHSDLGVEPVEHGCLLPWAHQGVLLLNTVLTVRAHEAHSHRKQGWETFTDAIIKTVAAKTRRVVFVFWGKPAQTKRQFIDDERHVVIESPHPSPLSARRGFFGSQPFSRINQALRNANLPEIDWQLPASPEPEWLK